MQEIMLSSGELVYVASVLGAKEFFGVSDPFFGMNPGEIAACLSKIQSDLNERGILEMDFSGNVQVCQSVADVVRKCAFCDAYALGAFQADGGTEAMTVYFKDQAMILLTAQDDTLCVRAAEMEEVVSAISTLLGEQTLGLTGASCKVRSSFHNQTIETLRQLVMAGKDTEAEKEMHKAGIDEAIGKVFMDSFRSGARLYSLVVTSFAANRVDVLLCITSHASLVCIEKDENPDTNGWIASTASGKEVVQGMKELLERARWSQ